MGRNPPLFLAGDFQSSPAGNKEGEIPLIRGETREIFHWFRDQMGDFFSPGRREKPLLLAIATMCGFTTEDHQASCGDLAILVSNIDPNQESNFKVKAGSNILIIYFGKASVGSRSQFPLLVDSNIGISTYQSIKENRNNKNALEFWD
ncbi:Uncharacterized protein Fot_15507 [Forsythia ovata]|uniref:Uncharacterized protein n=1 Tax=Forsythia ovata TaxID=205694 RepID=A0ABD1W9F0_9LAMI